MEMMEGLDADTDLFSVAQALPEPSDLMESEDDAPIIRLINALLTEAINEDASDIHIEPFEKRLSVRFRVDGTLREVLSPPIKVAPLLASRIKVMAKLDISEKRLPQDGRISLRMANHPVDVRVSTLPSGHGERVVMRLLDKKVGRLNLKSMGMAPQPLALLDELIHKPHGIILVTGPTGSGKTTTLYAALTGLNNAERNILTVEDPIEYDLDGVGQTQVNTKINMSFARGLRAILRQDPGCGHGRRNSRPGYRADCRAGQFDRVTWCCPPCTPIAASAPLPDCVTWALKVSCCHPVLLAVVSQRLVRRLDGSKQPFVAGDYECQLLGADINHPPTLFRPGTGDSVDGNGYRGRTGIYELISLDDHMRTMIHDGASEQDLERYARTRSQGLREDGVQKVLAGQTSIEELLRVTRSD